MWVKGTPLHFIVDSDSQKNLILAEVVKRLALPTTPHPQPYTIGWLHQGSDLRVNQQCRMLYDIKPFKDEVFFYFSPWMSVIFSWINHICGSSMFFIILNLVVSLLL